MSNFEKVHYSKAQYRQKKYDRQKEYEYTYTQREKIHRSIDRQTGHSRENEVSCRWFDHNAVYQVDTQILLYTKEITDKGETTQVFYPEYFDHCIDR